MKFQINSVIPYYVLSTSLSQGRLMRRLLSRYYLTLSVCYLFTVLRGLYRIFRLFFVYRLFLHVELEVEHCTLLAKVTCSNFVQILAIPIFFLAFT